MSHKSKRVMDEHNIRPQRTSRREFTRQARHFLIGMSALSYSRAKEVVTGSAEPVATLVETASLTNPRLPELVWTKQRRFLGPEGAPRWRSEHSGMVSVLPWENDTYRIFLTGRQPGSEFQIGWISLSRNLEILYENPDNPVLTSGRMGTFDCSGVCMPLVVRVTDSVLYMYYVGWGFRQPGLFQNNAGLAVSRDNGRTWKRYSEATFLPLDDRDPIGTGTVFVLCEDKKYWRMWYTSLIKWVPAEQNKPSWLLFYLIKYAESEDGIRWHKPKDNIAVDLLPGEQCTARPMVIKEPGGYRMWFSHRQVGSQYRIGYAESNDGIGWTRKPIDLAPSTSGWDSEMIEYAYVLKENNHYLMFYNGNGFGRTGTGAAKGILKTRADH